MPYPPPPAPPEVGEFQGIGLLPAPQIPDVTGHAGEFLETDGTIPQWEPVTGVLPSQGGHAGEFLTTDGSVASWAAVTAILPPQTGHAGQFLGTDGSTADWAVVPSNSFDIRDFLGAHPNDDTYDVAPAYYAALSQIQTSNPIPPYFSYQSGSRIGGIYFPEGVWYTSKPLLTTAAIEVFGDGQTQSYINVGLGTAATPSKVQGFSGPMMYGSNTIAPANLAAYSAAAVSFGAPLNGTSARSLHLTRTMWSLPLFDSWPWSWFLGMMYNTNLCLRFEYKIPSVPAGTNILAHIIGTEGPAAAYADPAFLDRALGVYVVSNGVTCQLQAYLTTCPDWTPGTFHMTTGVQQSITSGNVAINATINVEIDYNGSFFDFYINGVNQGHLAATGPVFRQPWEGATIGSGTIGIDLFSPSATAPIDSLLGCIELAAVARHTGTGSFSPTPGPYTADGSTLWLANWDQPDFALDPTGTVNLPFLEAKTAIALTVSNGPSFPTLSSPNLVTHYIPMLNWGQFTSWISVHDLNLHTAGNASGWAGTSVPQTNIERVTVQFPAKAALRLTDSNSFYSANNLCSVFAPCDIGIWWYGNTTNSFTLGAPLGVWAPLAGRITNNHGQPNFTMFANALLGPGASQQSLFEYSYSDNDAEVWSFFRQFGAVATYSLNGGIIYGRGNLIAATNSNHSPIYSFDQFNGELNISDTSWQPAQEGTVGLGGFACLGSPSAYVETPLGVSTSSSIIVTNPTIFAYFGPTLPAGTTPDTVSVVNAEGQTRTKGISTSDTQANNVAGTFTVQFGFTYGGATFLVPEADGNYEVVIQYKSFVGSAPAAGSTVPGAYTTTAEGFRMAAVDPGGTCVLTFSYHLIRTSGGAAYREYLPTFPASESFPLFPAQATDSFGVGITVVPASGHGFVWDSNQVKEAILNMGPPANSNHWFELYFPGRSPAGQYIQGLSGGLAGLDSAVTNLNVNLNRVSGTTSKLLSMYNPGTHNIVIGITGSTGSARVYLDGYLQNVIRNPPLPTWAGSSALLYLGEYFDASSPLTRATLRNRTIDLIETNCITFEQDSGPGEQPQASFFGDDWTNGAGSTSPLGGWANQVAEARYGTTYYWFPTRNQWFLTDRVGIPGLVSDLWSPWGQYRDLDTFVFLGGWYDLLNPNGSIPSTGISAATTWAEALKVLEGEQSSEVFHPPTTNTNAFAIYFTNLVTWTTAAAVINGITYSNNFATSAQNSMNLTAALINADTASNHVTAVVSASTQIPNTYVITCTAVAHGAAGNGISVSGTGAGQWYTGVPAANATFGGFDSTLTINGVIFNANFDTNAATTVNNMVTAITASVDPLISGIVTAANVANTLVTTAVTAGVAGDSINYLANGVAGANGAYNGSNPTTSTTHLSGGLNGLLARVPNIVMCTLPPFGAANAYYTAGKETERQTYNTNIRNWVTAHAGAGAVLADVDLVLKDGPGTSIKTLFNDGTGFPNNAGHLALFTIIAPLAPGVGTPPSALSYATNPATYASGGPIASNNPTVTGTVVRWTVSPPLPAGLVISSTTGHITGTPTTPTAIANYLVAATNTAGTITVSLSITIT